MTSAVESEGLGAASDEARATHEQSPQAVSAVPVGIPSAEEMSLQHATESLRDRYDPSNPAHDYKEQVTVTQADRQRAALSWRNFPSIAKAILAGTADQDGEVQAFARHRLASQAELVSALEESLRENIALRCIQGGGCDANQDGPHPAIVGTGKDRFCTECGEMVDARGRSTPWFHGDRLERAKARILRAAQSDSTP